MTVRLEVDGRAVEVPDGATVAAAVALVSPVFGRSSRGARRAPLCGMGVCFECRLTIDGVPGRRACIEPARAGMQVRTHE